MLDWEKRELELESRLLEYESDQDRALKTATMTMAVITQSSAAARGSGAHRFPAVEDLPDPALSVPEQLQYVLERLALKHKQLIEQAAAIRTLEKELEKVQGTAHQLQSALRSKEVDLSSAENQRANVSIAGMGATAKGWGGRRAA